jgi:hypothetical protein
MKGEGGNDESAVTLIESFNQHCQAFILHPSAFILSPEPVAQRKEERKYAKLEVARSNRARFIFLQCRSTGRTLVSETGNWGSNPCVAINSSITPLWSSG